MSEIDRELGIATSGDLPVEIDSRYRDRLLMVEEMEETAQVIQAKARGFDDVTADQVHRLEQALHALRADLRRRGGAPPEPGAGGAAPFGDPDRGSARAAAEPRLRPLPA